MSSTKQQEAQAILDYLASVPFENCIELSKEFLELPMQAAIYAVKHHQLGILSYTLAKPEHYAIAFEVDTKHYCGPLLKE
jgi:hypothetical protein